MRSGETPVLIPNTKVKAWTADGTALETVWESRRLPDLWGYSSVGRAPALQAGGQGFESLYLHSKLLRLRNTYLENCISESLFSQKCRDKERNTKKLSSQGSR